MVQKELEQARMFSFFAIMLCMAVCQCQAEDTVEERMAAVKPNVCTHNEAFSLEDVTGGWNSVEELKQTSQTVRT